MLIAIAAFYIFVTWYKKGKECLAGRIASFCAGIILTHIKQEEHTDSVFLFILY